MPESKIIRWSFMDRESEVFDLGEKTGYSWTCGQKHDHVITCLWVWHYCDLNLRPPPDHWTTTYIGWNPTGVGLHDLIAQDPLHIEASVYWPACCGMHGWIRDGKWVDA